jgi:hypothetical protein
VRQHRQPRTEVHADHPCSPIGTLAASVLAVMPRGKGGRWRGSAQACGSASRRPSRLGRAQAPAPASAWIHRRISELGGISARQQAI